jgi:hypothetical protein
MARSIVGFFSVYFSVILVTISVMWFGFETTHRRSPR